MKKEETETSETVPVCEKCGSALVQEDNELVCPQCQGKIDFFGDSPD